MYTAKFGESYKRIECDGFELDTVIRLPKDQPTIALAVVCHPQPRAGGNLQDPRVAAAAYACHVFGAATVRFNFRDDKHGDEQSIADAQAALQHLKSKVPGSERLPVLLIGYSYGGRIAAKLAQQINPAGYLGIAPATRTGLINSLDCPSWVIVGSDDSRGHHRYASAHKTLITGADHGFRGKREELRTELHRAVAQMMLPLCLHVKQAMSPHKFPGSRLFKARLEELAILSYQASNAINHAAGLNPKALHQQAALTLASNMRINPGQEVSLATQRLTIQMTLCSQPPTATTLLCLAVELFFDASTKADPLSDKLQIKFYSQLLLTIFAIAGNPQSEHKASLILNTALQQHPLFAAKDKQTSESPEPTSGGGGGRKG